MQEQQNQLAAIVAEQNSDIADKAANITELNARNASLENDVRNVCGGFLFGCRDLRRDEFMAILDTLQGEKDGLLEQVSVLNARLVDERERIAGLQEALRKHSVKFTRLEFKYSGWLGIGLQVVSVCNGHEIRHSDDR